MKILIYVHSWAPHIGGVETITRELAEGLTRPPKDGDSMQVTLATQTPAGTMDDASWPFRVVRQPGLVELLRLMRDADVIHVAGPALAPLILGLLLRKPLVVEHHGFQSTCPNGQLLYEPTRSPCPGHFMAKRYRECLRCNAATGRGTSWKMWTLTFARRWLCKAVSANITPTAWLEEQLKLPRTTTIHHGLSAGVGNQGVLVKDRQPGIINFTFQGRLVSTKGAQVILAAAGRLKSQRLPFHLNLIGDGPNRRNLESLAHEFQIHDVVRFLGYRSGQELEAALAEADAMLMPSLGGEVFGLVALESMLRGKLVVVSDIGALTEVVGDAGMVCSTGDVDAWATCMAKLIQNPALCSELGGKARERALKFFSEDTMIHEHLRMYERGITRSR
ncbi:MAG: glycosyltransferase family 4 protein [Candidatus Acidiferrales bacterium]|jgi:glycosyltransferase involved in cell wall biosynthesis